jgi:hypothetical protein
MYVVVGYVLLQVSATIHLANRNWAALVDDFIDLEFLPADANRCAADSTPSAICLQVQLESAVLHVRCMLMCRLCSVKYCDCCCCCWC